MEMIRIKSELFLTVSLKKDEQDIIDHLKNFLLNVTVFNIELLNKDSFYKEYKVIIEHDIILKYYNYLKN